MKKQWKMKLAALAAVVLVQGLLIACFGGAQNNDDGWLRYGEMAAGALFGMVGAGAALSLWQRTRNDETAQEMTLRMQDERGQLIAAKVNALVGTAALLGLAIVEVTAAAMGNRLFAVLGLVILLACVAVKYTARTYYEKKL